MEGKYRILWNRMMLYLLIKDFTIFRSVLAGLWENAMKKVTVASFSFHFHLIHLFVWGFFVLFFFFM